MRESAKNRTNFGDAHYRATLSTEQIDEMRRLFELTGSAHWGYRRLAVRFSVSRFTVRSIVKYERRCLR